MKLAVEKGTSFLQKSRPNFRKVDPFLNAEFHIILKRMTLEIGRRSSFFQLLTHFFYKSTLGTFRNFKITPNCHY